MQIFQLQLELVTEYSLFHEMGDISVFNSTVVLLPSCLSGKVSVRQHYGCEFVPHLVGF
jgi:hypothetical protein